MSCHCPVKCEPPCEPKLFQHPVMRPGILNAGGTNSVFFDGMTEFILCIDDGGEPASLIMGKVYRQLPDPHAESLGLVRIVDEDTSGQDAYLFPASLFVPIDLPEQAKEALPASGGHGR